MTLVFNNLEEFIASMGSELGTSEWVDIQQDRIDRFAQVIGDSHWLHVDPERAADGPFGTTIAQGFLTLSLVAAFANDIYRVDGLQGEVNCGIERVRFIAPVPCGSRLRATATLTEAKATAAATRTTVRFVVERESDRQTVMVADMIMLLSSLSTQP